jgi:hypothetical protein
VQKILLFFFLGLVLMGKASNASLFPAPDLSQLRLPASVQRENSWHEDLIQVHYENYKKNPKASFCTRPLEMIDTVVLHHSETPATSTPQYINQLHLNRGTAADPWYMIAYSYVINSPYAGSSIPVARLTEGRPLELVGAHAGSNAFVEMDDEQKRLWNEGAILCGKEGERPTIDTAMIRNGKIKANVTTVGVVVNGNYSPFSRTNPSGFSKTNPRYPTLMTQDMIARLSCQLQKKHPRIKNIKWHHYYNATSCPGTIRDYIEQIKLLAKAYGCEFH